jgi:hypothetical protein
MFKCEITKTNSNYPLEMILSNLKSNYIYLFNIVFISANIVVSLVFKSFDFKSIVALSA